ncbi:hypothetical protein I6F35_22355 [Bradyrhizobium sp. BRP22]|uniref:hypothetical protein n=1 Tax=Bradyrhizobium sp. BRP22 TaxID=2793821 RepID=UPI001CD556CD|nr:hypothetical protein [Bradyrhizobium sp. BRP22]MCA1455912.1 hypothetical protein [Bradyrhizobium sp. BRP22]
MLASLIYLVIYLVVVGVIMWLLHYLVNAVPMDEPFRRVANVVIVVIGVLIVIVLLLNFAGIIDAGAPRLAR